MSAALVGPRRFPARFQYGWHVKNRALTPPRFPPVSARNWAYQADARSFTDVPFRGFLGPPLEAANLTSDTAPSPVWVGSISQSPETYNRFRGYGAKNFSIGALGALPWSLRRVPCIGISSRRKSRIINRPCQAIPLRPEFLPRHPPQERTVQIP